jgi:hypothetical protein
MHIEKTTLSETKMTIHLKATDEATFNQALIDAGWAWQAEYAVDEEGNPTEDVIKEAGTAFYTASHSLDVIGVIHKETGNIITVEATDDMPEYTYPETAPIDGWHANLLLHGEELPEALADFVIEAPANPVRKFA